MKISKKVAGVEYAIRDIVSAAREIELQGKTVDYLNIGDPVQCGFQPPQNVKQAMIDAINNGNNFYTRSEGLSELTEAIAKKENAKGLSISSENILVTNGVSEGLDMVISSIVEEGDEVLLPGPYYPPYASYVRLHGGVPIEFSVDLNSSSPDIDDIKSKITPKTVAICLISPNNPTGLVFNENALRQIHDLRKKYKDNKDVDDRMIKYFAVSNLKSSEQAIERALRQIHDLREKYGNNVYVDIWMIKYFVTSNPKDPGKAIERALRQIHDLKEKYKDNASVDDVMIKQLVIKNPTDPGGAIERALE